MCLHQVHRHEAVNRREEAEASRMSSLPAGICEEFEGYGDKCQNWTLVRFRSSGGCTHRTCARLAVKQRRRKGSSNLLQLPEHYQAQRKYSSKRCGVMGQPRRIQQAAYQTVARLLKRRPGNKGTNEPSTRKHCLTRYCQANLTNIQASNRFTTPSPQSTAARAAPRARRLRRRASAF